MDSGVEGDEARSANACSSSGLCLSAINNSLGVGAELAATPNKTNTSTTCVKQAIRIFSAKASGFRDSARA